ncbi:MAG: flagellar hook-basal body complex protein FliE [Armatimonadota bacterium]
MRIESITPLQPATKPEVTRSTDNGDDFGRMLTDALKEVNQAQVESGQVQRDFMAGRNIELHELVFAMERASVSLELTMQVRNKLLEAYKQIEQMQI